MIEVIDHQIGTYATLLIQSSAALTKIIDQKSTYVKDQIKESSSTNSPILTPDKLNNTLSGPFQKFFKQHLHTLAHIAKVMLAVTVYKGEVLKSKDFEEDVEYDISEYLLNNTEPSELTKLNKALETLIDEHFMQLESQVQSWSESVLSAIQSQELPLTEMEAQEFIVNEPLSELRDRFIDLKVEPIKIKKNNIDFRAYMTLKAMLAIHSALSRLHQPNTHKDIQAILNKIKPALKNIQEAEAALMAEQKTALDELTKPIEDYN